MKLYLIFVGACCVFSSLFAQSPFLFNFQGVATDGSQNIIVDKEISLLITIVSNFQDGPIEYAEQHFVTPNRNGIFNITIGEGTILNGNLRNIDWGSNSYYIRTEIDINGGSDFIEMGTSRLLSVPYALYAMKAGNAEGGTGEDKDEQTLSLSGTNLSISNGNSISLSSLSGSDNQTLSLNGNNLNISNGNSVDLSGLTGGEDADSDPTNELQDLSISGNQLSISNGNTVNLPTGGNGGISPWSMDGNNLFYGNGSVEVRTQGAIGTGIQLSTTNQSGGRITTYRSPGIVGVDIFSGNLGGEVSVFNSSNPVAVMSTSGTAGTGKVETYNAFGDRLTLLGSTVTGNGSLTTYSPSGNQLTSITSSSSGAGYFSTKGQNGNENANFTNLGSNVNHGYISAKDANGNVQAAMYVDADGNGRLTADMKNFLAPQSKDPYKLWVYTSLEGPEAAAYLRGSTLLNQGQAYVAFPDHFQDLVNHETMTIMLTPLSGESKGLAVIKKTAQGFTVVELAQGKGSYKFDWEVKGVRKGYENYQVEVFKNELMPADQYTNDLKRKNK